MILGLVAICLLLAFVRVCGEFFFEQHFPWKTLPLFGIFLVIALYALTNL